MAARNINSSQFPIFVSLAGNSLMGAGATTQPVALGPGQSLALTGFDATAASNARLAAFLPRGGIDRQLEDGIALAFPRRLAQGVQFAVRGEQDPVGIEVEIDVADEFAAAGLIHDLDLAVANR